MNTSKQGQTVHTSTNVQNTDIQPIIKRQRADIAKKTLNPAVVKQCQMNLTALRQTESKIQPNLSFYQRIPKITHF